MVSVTVYANSGFILFIIDYSFRFLPGLFIATGTAPRCRPDAMNEKFRKVDTQLHGIFYGAI